MTEDEKIIDLLEKILEQERNQSQQLEDIKNLFLKYDDEELLEDEQVRMG